MAPAPFVEVAAGHKGAGRCENNQLTRTVVDKAAALSTTVLVSNTGIVHELSICRSILREVAKAAEAGGPGKVCRIRLQLGPLAALSAAELQSTLPLVSRGSIAEGAEIITEMLPLRVKCNGCQCETEATTAQLRCGACGHTNVRPLNGDELLLVGIELSP